MKNQSIKIKKNAKESAKDQSNAEIIKGSIAKESPKMGMRSSLYKGLDNLSIKDQKIKRSGLRRKLDKFISDCIGKDRKKEEKEISLDGFLQFYKENWKIQDFKMDHFSNQIDPDFRRDAEILLNLAKKRLG